MGNEQSNKYRNNNQVSRQKHQDLDSSVLSTNSNAYYSRTKQIQQPKHVLQHQNKKEMSMQKRNQLDISESRANRNKSSIARNQVQFDEQPRIEVRSVSPNRSQLLLSSVRSVQQNSLRRRHQVDYGQKLDLIKKATEFCVDSLLNQIEYDNSAFLNSLPIQSGMISSQNLTQSSKQDDSSTIKDFMKNKTKEELFLREKLKRDFPFSHKQDILYSQYFGEKSNVFQDPLSRQQQIVSLLQSKPIITQSAINDSSQNQITLNPFGVESKILESKPSNRQTFMPLVPEKPKEEEKEKINIKDFFTIDQQLSGVATRKSIRQPKNDDISGEKSPFSNLFSKAVSQEKQNEEFIGILPVKTNAEVMEKEKPPINQSSYSNKLYTSNYPQNNTTKLDVQASIIKSNYEQITTPPPIIKKTIEINERIIENNNPNSNLNYNSNLNNSYLNNTNLNNSYLNNNNNNLNNSYLNNSYLNTIDNYKKPITTSKIQQIYDYEPKPQSNINYPASYSNQSYTKVDQYQSQLSHQPLSTGFQNDYKSQDQYRNPSPNNSDISKKNPQNNFYATTEKLKVKVKRIEIPENSDYSQYESSNGSEEDEDDHSKTKRGMRLREYEESRNGKNKKSRKENNISTNNNQSYLNNSYTNINQVTTSNNNLGNTQYRNTSNNQNNTLNNSYLTYNNPDQSPYHQQTPSSPYLQKSPSYTQQQPSSFTTHKIEQIENRTYNTYEPDRNQNYDNQDFVKKSKYDPQNSNNMKPNQFTTSQNNYLTTSKPQQTFNVDQSVKVSNNYSTLSPNFSQYNSNNNYQPQDYSNQPIKTIPLHAPDSRERANQNQITPRNLDYQNNEFSTTPRGTRQPIFSNQSSQLNSIQINPQKSYVDNLYSQSPLLNKQAQNPKNYEKITDINFNEQRTEIRNPSYTTPIQQSYTPRDNQNPPSTSQILNQSYTNINQSRNYQPENRSYTPPPQRNEDTTEKVTTTTTVYEHGVSQPKLSYQVNERDERITTSTNRGGLNRLDNYDKNYNEIYSPQQPQPYSSSYQTQKYQKDEYQPQQNPPQQQYYQKQQQPSQIHTNTLFNTKINETTYSQKQNKKQDDGTNVYIVVKNFFLLI